MPGYSYESRRAARQRKRAAFNALREQVSPLVQQGDQLSLERARQITAKYERENSETPQVPTFMRKIGEAARQGLQQRLDAQRQEAMDATGGKKRAGVPRGVAEAFPEEAVDRKVYDSPDPLGQKFAKTGAGGFLKEVGAMVLNAGRPGVGAVNAALQGDNPIGGAFREGGDVYDAEGRPLERYSALNNPVINRLPDSGISAGPVHITPKTAAGFGFETAADWTSYVDLPIGQAAVAGARKVLRRGGADVAEQVATKAPIRRVGSVGFQASKALDPKLAVDEFADVTDRFLRGLTPNEEAALIDYVGLKDGVDRLRANPNTIAALSAKAGGFRSWLRSLSDDGGRTIRAYRFESGEVDTNGLESWALSPKKPRAFSNLYSSGKSPISVADIDIDSIVAPGAADDFEILVNTGGGSVADQVAKPSFLQSLGQKVAPSVAGGAIGPKLDPMHPYSATQRLFNIKPPKQQLTRIDRAANAIKDVLGIGVPDNELATPIMRERRRVMRNVESQAARMGQVAAEAEQHFTRDAKGRITNLPGEPTLQDLAARLPQYQQYLSAEQVSALQRLKAETEPFNDALGELGVDIGSRADVVDGGFYLPRGQAGKEGVDAPMKVRSGRGMAGGKTGAEKHATFDSMTEGINAGYEYASFRDAMQSYAQDAGVRATDQWTADAFKATGLGETAADRINPGLRDQVEKLRQRIATKRATLVRQRARQAPLKQASRDTARMAQNAETLASKAGGRMESIAGRAGRREEALASRADDMLGKAAGREEKAAQSTEALAQNADARLQRLQARVEAVRNPKLPATPEEGVPRETFSFQQLVASLPDQQELVAKSNELRAQLSRDANGQIRRNRANSELMRQIGEYDALNYLHQSLQRADGDVGLAMDYFDETLQREGFALQSRNDPGLRTLLSGNQSRRARAARRRQERQGISDMYVRANRGSDADYGILSEQVRAMNDILEAGDFDVYESLDTPAKLGPAPTEAVLAAAQRELNILMREARKQSGRADTAAARAVRQGDALMNRAQRDAATTSGEAVRAGTATQRQAQRGWKTAQRSADRLTANTARMGQTGTDYDALRDQLRNLERDWKVAKEKAAYTPREQGSIGLAGLNGTTFPDELANVANKYLQSERPISGKGSLPIKTVQALNSVLRGLRASADISFMGIQGLLGAVTHPGDYKTALVVAMKAAKDPNVLGDYMRNFDEAARAAKLPDSRSWAAAGLRIGGSDTEFAVGRGISGKIGAIGTGDTPLVGLNPIRGSNRMFGFFGDTLRLEAANSMAMAAKAGKKPLSPDYLQEIGRAANLLTGYTDKSLGGETGQLLMFAPRFFASQLELVGRAMTLDPSAAGDEARTALIRLIGTGTLITVGINEARGQETDFNPKSSNFMRIRDWGGQDISLFGPWDSLVRGIAATSQGDWDYIPRTKASPTVALVWDQITGKTFTGKDSRTPEYFARAILPFSLSDIGDESPLSTGVNSAGVKATPLSPREQIDKAARDKYKRGWGDLTLEERGILAGERPDLAQQLADAKQGKYGEYEDAKKRTNAQVKALNEQLLSGQMTREDWRDQIDEANTRLQGARDQIFGQDQEPPSAEAQARDPAMKYLAIRMEFRDKKTGLVDEAAFQNAVHDRMSASEIEAAFRGFGADDQPLQKLRSKVAREYYSIPRYQGLSAEQGQEIDRAWEQVLAIAGNTDNRLKKLQALRNVEVEDPRVKMALYRRVYGHGLKLDGRREQWAKRNPGARPLLGLGRGAVTEEEQKALARLLGSGVG